MTPFFLGDIDEVAVKNGAIRFYAMGIAMNQFINKITPIHLSNEHYRKVTDVVIEVPSTNPYLTPIRNTPAHQNIQNKFDEESPFKAQGFFPTEKFDVPVEEQKVR